MFPMKTLENLFKNAPVLRGIETTHGFVSAVCRRKNPASHSRLKDVVRRCVEQNKRDNNFNARTEDRSLQVAAA